MNEELRQRVKQFKADFLDRYPDVEQPLPMLADFAAYLNEVKTASTGHGEMTQYGETIHSILVLLSNSDLERFANAGFKMDALTGSTEAGNGATGEHPDSGDADAIERGANEAVYGNADLAGLKGLVAKLIGE